LKSRDDDPAEFGVKFCEALKTAATTGRPSPPRGKESSRRARVLGSDVGGRIPGASVIGRKGSLIGRIKSLFAHLGNWLGKPLNYSVLRRS